ncbi:EAL domain, c-di-GMP-specific phosphodiesterase class I (or its enzymatically inactive variant) [Parafrankia irregularis]|uniref:EAL domain, c-di-GMP-specific phosphodiesterase class I (Or its enzymatically inactive variant) n=1 Tax=Parafrankia irregularis TaxID=795642 RepID=A0A0S4QMX4_9ACTN|nr:EAL domain-containing protein [Parafrankia sp. CH37]MBE3201303.1 EAL domain-containing protein [Parafrankia sp. CH37]CUU56248.1 EAL domain, c-di-GMP-specific phosphodiesterase class I (or its enzymatically inactive variant) [Parafrankia irregularis]
MSRRHVCLGPQSEVPEPSAAVVDLLGLLQRRTGMDLAWLGRFDGQLLVLQTMSGNPRPFGLSPGCSVRYEEVLFGQVRNASFPPLIPDTRRDPRTESSASVRELGVGAYAAMPVLDASGRLYGLLGCLNRHPRPSLGERDGRLLWLLAEFLTGYVSDLREMWEARSRTWSRIQNMIDEGDFTIAYQPIVDLRTGRPVALEALTRLENSPGPGPLFTDAADVGLGPELELAAIRRALTALPELPGGVRLAVNASPSTLLNGLVGVLLESGAPERLAVEITENEYLADDHDLLASIRTLRDHDIRIVVDDMGTCFAGLQLVLRLRPDVIKIDRFIVRGMPTDPAHQAVAAGVTTIAQAIGSRVVAEGIETTAELAAARDASLDYGQGFLLATPTPNLRTACAPTTPRPSTAMHRPPPH